MWKLKNYVIAENLCCYGFRGEALSSLCAVSQVSITTKTVDDDVAMCYSFNSSGQVISCKASHLPKGKCNIIISWFNCQHIVILLRYKYFCFTYAQARVHTHIYIHTHTHSVWENIISVAKSLSVIFYKMFQVQYNISVCFLLEKVKLHKLKFLQLWHLTFIYDF